MDVKKEMLKEISNIKESIDKLETLTNNQSLYNHLFDDDRIRQIIEEEEQTEFEKIISFLNNVNENTSNLEEIKNMIRDIKNGKYDYILDF